MCVYLYLHNFYLKVCLLLFRQFIFSSVTWKYLPKNKNDQGQQQQTTNDAADQNPQWDGNGSAFENFQNSLKTHRHTFGNNINTRLLKKTQRNRVCRHLL